jgi:cathepsin L
MIKYDQHNQEGHSYTLGLTQFSDMTEEEFNTLLGVRVPKRRSIVLEEVEPIVGDEDIDWTKKDKVHPVKDQASCGSCWAFSAIASFEAVISIEKNDKVKSFSEQQLVDCSWPQGN